ncbi:MAG: FeoA family protein [Oscillospiraceae bacterium]|nr:FeoA family protein [Oscillospiraceae bacterium]
MNRSISLNTLQEGQSARVERIASRSAMRRRLQDIGLTSGTAVTCLGRSPFGDPAAFCIRGAVIALRDEDSRDVIVSPS